MVYTDSDDRDRPPVQDKNLVLDKRQTRCIQSLLALVRELQEIFAAGEVPTQVARRAQPVGS